MQVPLKFYWVIHVSGTRGPWTDAEVSALKDAVHKLTKTPLGTPVHSDVEWSAVARLVKTRNAAQCRKKW